MNWLINRVSISLLLTLGLLSTGCFETSDPPGSSGSNWLTCRTLEDCESDEAVCCDSDGYCLDKDGERIAADSVDADDERDAGLNPIDARYNLADLDADLDDGLDAGNDAMVSEPPLVATCAWGVSDILAEASLVVPNRVYCGEYNSGSFESGADCFFVAIEGGQAAQLSLNYSEDDMNLTTYVATKEGDYYAVLMEDGQWGDEWREAKLERCGDLVRVDMNPETGLADIICAPREELYQCTEPRWIPRAYRVEEVPVDGAGTTTLHLYLSNQSSDNPIAQFSVFIEDAEVVRGDFDVGNQHNWSLFDIEVPAGTLTIRAQSFYMGEEFQEQIEVPTERWAVLDYWYSHDESGEDFSGEEFFTLWIYEEPVKFR